MSFLDRIAKGFFASESLVGHLLCGGVAAVLFGWRLCVRNCIRSKPSSPVSGR
jgi:hypothetical protein